VRSASIACLRPISICWSASTCRAKASALDAADEVQFARLTPQHQSWLVNEPSFAVVRSYRDQLVRAEAIDAKTLDQVDKFADCAERYRAEGQDAAAKAELNALANQLEGAKYDALRAARGRSQRRNGEAGRGIARRPFPHLSSGITLFHRPRPAHHTVRRCCCGRPRRLRLPRG